MGFPSCICISTNDILIHGIPSTRPFADGDWVNLDVTVFKDGFFGDNSRMVCVGDVLPDVKRLINTTENCLMAAIEVCKPGTSFTKIGEVITFS